MTTYKKEDYRRALRLACKFILASDAHKMVIDHLNNTNYNDNHEELLLDYLYQLTQEIQYADAREPHAPAQDNLELFQDTPNE